MRWIFNLLTEDEWLSLLRTVVKSIAAIMVARGYQNDDMATMTVSIIMGIAPIAFDMMAHSEAGQIATATALPDDAKISIAAAVPDVAKIVTTPERAKADPSEKVVASLPSQTQGL